MPHVSLLRTLAVRLGVFAATAVVICLAAGTLLPRSTGEGAHNVLRYAHPLLYAYLMFVVLGTVLARRRLSAIHAALLFLLGDLIAIGGLGAAMRSVQQGDSYVASAAPFVVAYLVAVLVAVMGRRTAAAILGPLAGTMVLALGSWLVSVVHGAVPDFYLLAGQLALVIAAAVEGALVTGWLESDDQRRRMAERVEKEIKAREAEAGELVAFAQSLATSGTIHEIGEAVVRYMRTHLPVRARAVVVEAKGECTAIWEEAGKIEADHAERRRQRLQESLARAGSNHLITRVDVRSVATRPVPVQMDYLSLVEVPIQIGGRVAGVVLVADPARGAIPERRIGILADMVRRTGEAMLRIERQSDEEQRRTALLLRQMREGVLLLGPEGQALLANPAAREALKGNEAADGALTAVGETSLLDLASTPPGVTRRFRAEVKPAGGHRPVLLACTAVAIMESGRRVGTLVTLADVTEEELARGRLVQSEKLTLVGQTLAGVAHELNNPLAALIGYADLLDTRELPNDLERPIRQMREQAMRAARIVRNLLSFAKQRNPERLPTRVGDLVQGVVDLFAYEIRLANITITADVESELPAVLGDKHALQQVLVNVVQNAIHALQEQEGERHIQIGARALPDAVVVSVQDSGPGVPQDFRVRIFEPFFTTKGASRGTGLGLALSRTIAREHGGDLVLEPDSGHGACFTLRLPLPRVAKEELTAPLDADTATNGAAASPAAPVPQASGAFHILVVDDEPAVRDALVAQLGRMGCRVDSAANSTEAHRQILRADYQAVLLDVRMPGGTGLELYERLRKEKPSVLPSVVFMTGDFTNDEVLTGIRATGNPFLEKPFTLDELSRSLHGRPGAPVPDRMRARAVTIGAA